MSTLNLLYNTNNPGIHYIVSAGQNINITELGTYNVVPIDLQALIGGSNKSIYSDNLFDKVNIPNMSNISGGGDVVCNEEMMNNNISSNMSSSMTDNMSNMNDNMSSNMTDNMSSNMNGMNRDNSDNNMNGNMSNMNRDNNDNNTLLTSSNNYNTYSDTYSDTYNNARQSNSMLDSCRGVKSDNRYTPSIPLDRNTLFTDNLSKLVFNINQGH